MLVPEEQNMTRTEQPDAPKQIAIKQKATSNPIAITTTSNNTSYDKR
jgi:hypothetical protein